MTGLSVNVFRSDLGDCTNGGVTSPAHSAATFVVFDDAVRSGNWAEEECRDSPKIACLRLVRRQFGDREYIHAVPMDAPTGKHGMFGGNFIYTSDSRFREICDYPIPVHDRYETQAEYDALTI